MNIAIFTHNYPTNSLDRKDAGIFIYDFDKELEKKHKVYVFCPNYGNNEKFGNWSLFNPVNAFKFFKNIFYGINESIKFVQSNKVDYILSAWAIPSGIYAYILNIKYKIPYGIWYLGSDLNIYSKLPIISSVINIVSKNATNLFANSYALTQIANRKYGKCDMLPASTKVIGSKETSKIIAKFNKKLVNILYVGRLEKVKGPDILVEAFMKLGSRYKLWIIGDGTMRSKLISLNTKNVSFLGYRGLPDIVNFFKKSDFMVVPSRNESLPLVILEAANYNLPVLASDVGDCKYILNKYMIGETFKKGDIDEIVHKIKNFKYQKIKNNGQFLKLNNDYNLKSSVNKFLNIIT